MLNINKNKVCILFVAVIMFSCSNNQDSERTKAERTITEMTPLVSRDLTLLDYVFIDSNDVLHTTRRCHVLEDSHTYNGIYISTERLPDIKVYSVCSQCVNYETWKELRACGIVIVDN